MMYDEFRELLVRIDERVKSLDERVDNLETKIEYLTKEIYSMSRRNGWREKGVVALLASAIVGLVEILRRVFGNV